MPIIEEKKICPYFKGAFDGPQYGYLGDFKDLIGHGHAKLQKLDLGLDPTEQAYFEERKGEERSDDDYEPSGQTGLF